MLGITKRALLLPEQQAENTKRIKVGEIVVMKDSHKAHYWWKLDRVIEIVKGRDDQVCGANVRVLHRPKQHLVPTEVAPHYLDRTIK